MICSVFLCLGGIHVGLGDLVCTSLGCIPTGCTVTLLRDLGRFRISPAGLPYIYMVACASVVTLLLSYVPVIVV